MARLGTAPSPVHLERVRAEQLVRTVEVNIAKLVDPELDLALDLLERLERAYLGGHTANLLRIDDMSARALAADEVATG